MASAPPKSKVTVFISPKADSAGDGSAARPFGSLADVASNFGLDSQIKRLAEAGTVQIIRIDHPGNAVECSKPRRKFYVDTHLLGSEGDGTERDPWPSFSVAVDGIIQATASKGDTLRDGECIEINHRQMFTSSSLEKKKLRSERIAHIVFLMMTLSLVAPVVGMLGYLVYQAWPALSFGFLVENPRSNNTEGGIWAPLIGTFFVVLISLIVAAPIGILAGVYLNEYAKNNWWTRIINLAVVNLAGVPSIVHGLFGVGAFVAFANMGKSLLAASCTLAVMTLPVIIASTKEALGSVPMSFREACWNLGASRWQTIRTIVLPNSISGILTGVILQVARAAGETAPILYTGVTISKSVADNGIGYWLPFGLNDKFMALSNHLFVLAKQNQFVKDEVVFATAVVLIGLVLAVNSIAIVARLYLRSQKRW
ncbi:MAG: phosphate ABC transporter permease PstA [Planctomycetales bacterium]|nr:phosphate ABC transporter permease PstA [Planctomycetales bacterium]